MEAERVEGAASPAVDAVPVVAPEVPRIDACLSELAEPPGENVARRVLDESAYELLVATVRSAPAEVVDRVVRLTEAHRPTMPHEHRRIDDVFREFATAPKVREEITLQPARTVPRAQLAHH
jgi:hypothetical protein